MVLILVGPTMRLVMPSSQGQGPIAVARPAPVLTVALQAADPHGERRTERQLLSLAVGQGVLSPWLEEELASMEPGALRRWRVGPRERPHGEISQRVILIGGNMLQDAGLYTFRFADGSGAEARYSFIYIFKDGEWKISHHRSSLQPESAD
jgi:hypothetical protein